MSEDAKRRTVRFTDEEWEYIKARDGSQYILAALCAFDPSFPYSGRSGGGAPDGNLNAIGPFVIEDETEAWIAADVANTIENDAEYEYDAGDFQGFDLMKQPTIPVRCRRPIYEAINAYRENRR
jgi:hypothetical protein